MKQKKIDILKLSKVSYTVVTILRICEYIGAAALAVVLVIIANEIVNPASVTDLIGRLSAADLLYSELDPAAIPQSLLVLLVQSIVRMGAFSMALLYTGRIFKTTQNGQTPFVESNVHSLKRVSLYLLLSTVAPGVVSIILCTIFGSENNAQFDLGLAVCAVVLLWLALVFDHGAKLQRDADETL